MESTARRVPQRLINAEWFSAFTVILYWIAGKSEAIIDHYFSEKRRPSGANSSDARDLGAVRPKYPHTLLDN